MFESENRKSSNQNRKIKIGIIEAEIRIEATQLTRRIVTALLAILVGLLTCIWLWTISNTIAYWMRRLDQNSICCMAFLLQFLLMKFYSATAWRVLDGDRVVKLCAHSENNIQLIYWNHQGSLWNFRLLIRNFFDKNSLFYFGYDAQPHRLGLLDVKILWFYSRIVSFFIVLS